MREYLGSCEQENGDFHQPERQNRYITKRVISSILVLSGIATGIAVKNRELIHTAWNMATYETPNPNDIIPELTGCDTDSQAIDEFVAAQENITNGGSANLDLSFKKVHGAKSVATSKPMPPMHSPETDFEHRTKLFWPGKNYFNIANGESYVSPKTGIEFIKMINERDPEYNTDWSEVERYLSDVFKLKQLYKHPGVHNIVTCYERRYQNNEVLGLPVEFSVLYDKRLCTDGNVVAKLSENQSRRDCRESGFGSPNVSFSIMPGIKLIDSRYLVIAGSADTKEDLNETVNRRIRHELLHLVFFQDLSDFAAEADEQERMIQYIEKVLNDHYIETDTMPQIISSKHQD